MHLLTNIVVMLQTICFIDESQRDRTANIYFLNINENYLKAMISISSKVILVSVSSFITIKKTEESSLQSQLI